MKKEMKEIFYLITSKINGIYKKDVDKTFKIISDFIISTPYEIFDEIRYCKITAFDNGYSIGNITCGEFNFLSKKPFFYCSKVILEAIEQIEKYFGGKINIHMSYRIIIIDILKNYI